MIKKQETFMNMKIYHRGENPQSNNDWAEVPRKIRAKLVKEILPPEFIEKLDYLGLIDEIFNDHERLPDEKTYKDRLKHYLIKYPTFEEFIFEACHWNIVRGLEHESKAPHFEDLYYKVFSEIFPRKTFKLWLLEDGNKNKWLSDFIRETKFNKI